MMIERDLGMVYKIALIPGDGIGKEVVPEAVRVMDVLSSQYGFELAYTAFPYSCEYYLKTGTMMPDDGIDQLRHFDAIFLGAVGRSRGIVYPYMERVRHP